MSPRLASASRAALVLALLALPPSLAPRAARAWTYGDTLTTIMRPLPSLPALVERGTAFTVWASAPSSTGAWAASLQLGALAVPLVPSGGGWQASKGRWELAFTVPANTPEEIYSLVLTSNATLLDVADHAVKVLPAFKADYYFAQISDTHVPTHVFSSGGFINVADTSGLADFAAVIEDLNVIRPEFILHTGDFVNEGELEEYLGMYEMGRAQGMLNRLRSPVFVVSGNHDQGGWDPTPPPEGTARKNWWRYFGWPWLLNPPAGDPYHSQDFSFDYHNLHVIGLEGYINNGSYDNYRQDLWGAQSFTAEQMARLQADIAAQPAGRKKLAFYHYDFGGTQPNGSPGANFSQINPGALGLDAVLWGHNHGVSEGNLAARPINLGLRSVIDRRYFRIFRVSNGVITPGPMHCAGGTATVPTDSMSFAWSGPSDGTRASLSVTVNNRYADVWEHARIRFVMVDHDSSFVATGGTVAQTIFQGGVALVEVDCVLPSKGVATVSVQTAAPVAGVEPAAAGGLRLAPRMNPFRAGAGALRVSWTLQKAAVATLEVLDLQGRRVATLADGFTPAGEHESGWDGRADRGPLAPPAMYVLRLRAGPEVRMQRIVLVR